MAKKPKKEKKPKKDKPSKEGKGNDKILAKKNKGREQCHLACPDYQERPEDMFCSRHKWYKAAFQKALKNSSSVLNQGFIQSQ